MPPAKRYQREDIINAAYKIVEEKGIENLNARRIAKELNCSIQPIFHNFATMDQLKENLYKKIMEVYHDYLSVATDSSTPYKQMGINLIKFAKEKPKLFQLIFMTPTNLTPENFVRYDISFGKVEKYASACTKLSGNDVRKFHTKMWIFTHGIATLVASKTCEFTDDQIDQLLSEQYQALMKLEENKS